jgi:hypothetical protein
MTQNRTRKSNRKSSGKKPAKSAIVLNDLPPPSPLRGLLPTPPEVAKLVAREVKRLPMTEEARRQITNDWTLQYYFGGHEIAYRRTPQGVEVLAAGLEEISQLLRTLPLSQRKGIIFGHPEGWW